MTDQSIELDKVISSTSNINSVERVYHAKDGIRSYIREFTALMSSV